MKYGKRDLRALALSLGKRLEIVITGEIGCTTGFSASLFTSLGGLACLGKEQRACGGVQSPLSAMFHVCNCVRGDIAKSGPSQVE